MNFKVITGYPDYLISESGEIFSLKSNRNLKPYKTTKGYLQVRLDKRTLGYKNTNIGACCNGKMKRAYGFIWRYIE